jgi:DNA-binding transcriptional LysR family regulator
MQLDAVRLFCEVAQHRSVSRAAELHGVTQSAASQRIQGLERELGVQLIDRSTRPLSLTAAGELYFRGCRRILASYERLKQRVAITGHHGQANGTLVDDPELRGEVAIAAIYSSGIDLLNQVTSAFEREHPRATISINYLQPEAVYDAVRHDQCDIGILSYPQRWAGIGWTHLREEPMAVVMRAGHPLARAEVVHAGELAAYDVVSFDTELPIGRHIRKYLGQHCEGAQVVNQFDNIDTIKTYVAQADAVAILPRRTVQREVAAGILAAATLVPRLTRPLGIVYSRSRPQRPLVRAFVEYLLKNQPPPPPETREVKTEAMTV